MTELLPLDRFEIHTGMLIGPGRTPAPPVPAKDADVHKVLDDLLLSAVRRPPCHVSFSGGRDSSVILAAATRVARREGLPDPVPLTARYPWHPGTHENEWQEMVVDHLRLSDWKIFELTTELDALGELATGLLRRHGVYLPGPAHSMAAFARRCGEGSLLTGTGGDEVLEAWGYRRRPLRQLVAARPRRRIVKRLAFEALPAVARKRLEARDAAPMMAGWMRPAARRWVAKMWRADHWWDDITWRRRLISMLGFRSYEVTRTTLDRFARDEGVDLVEPFFDPRFVHALARSAPRMGYSTRTEAMTALFAGLLPPEVERRRTKAVFNAVMAGPGARAFAESWDGSGVDDELVDPELLRAEWLKETPDGRTFTALQQAWLDAQ